MTTVQTNSLLLTRLYRGSTNTCCFVALLLTMSVMNTLDLQAAESNQTHAHEQVTYVAHSNDMARVDQALSRAIQHNKRLLLVLGAQWCHDSKGFAAKIMLPDVQSVINENYETLFVDVGNYKDKRNITQRFGYPTVFGTPTVLIIDPASETLLNLDTLTRFNNADAMPAADYVTYFADFTAKTYSRSDLAVSVKELEKFEQAQTQRLVRAYEMLSTYMQADDEGKLEDKKPFRSLWRQVRDFRFQLQKDIHALRSGELSDIPTYETQVWE